MSQSVKKISNFQLINLIIGFIVALSIVITPGQSVGQDAWMAVILGCAEGLIVAWIFLSLSKQFNYKSIIEINSIVFGKTIGTCISILFIWYIFHIGSIYLDLFGRFLKLEIYFNTPMIVEAILVVVVCALTVNRGVEVLARCATILVAIIVVIMFTDTALLIPNMDFNNLLPIMDVSVGDLLWAGHNISSIMFGETVVFLMLMRFVDKKRKAVKSVYIALLVSGIMLLIVYVRNIAVLGGMFRENYFASYFAIQAINVSEALARMEVLIGIYLIGLEFVRVSILMYCVASGLAQVIKLRSYRTLIVPISALLLVSTAINNLDILALRDFFNNGYPIYSTIFQVGIPLITLVVAKLRKLPYTEGEAV